MANLQSIKSNVPKNIGIILDGNRTFAKKLMLKPFRGHEWGAKKVEKLFDWCRELKIKELTLYALSLENLNSRPKEELDYLLKLFKKEFKKLLHDKKIHKHKIKINFIGRLNLLPLDLQKILYAIMEDTKNYEDYTINFALAYGGRVEVLDAVIKIAEQVKKGSLDIKHINEETFSNNLYTNSEPDLIIRTGKEVRTSNFLIWQSAYSEWYFLVEKTWPEFEKQDLVNAINSYSQRNRKFGR